MKSIAINLGGIIQMPEFQGRLLYMHKTNMDNIILPEKFKDYKETVEQVLSKIYKRDNVCYITIDEKTICNETHRRPGIHCDLNWYEGKHGHDTSGHKIKMRGDHALNEGAHGTESGKWGPYWKGFHDAKEGTHAINLDHIKGGMLLVSNFAGCRVYKGEFDGPIKKGGDCSLVDVSKLESEIMPAGYVYYLNALGIHESLEIPVKVNRSLLRINFHPNYIYK